MTEAGFANGLDATLLHYVPTINRKQAEVIQAMWSKVGIRLNLEPAEMATAKAKVKNGEFEVHAWGLTSSLDPPHYNRTFTCDGEANWSNYCNKEVDKCMFDAEVELDQTKRADLYKKCQRMMYEDAMMGGLYLTPGVGVSRKEVQGIRQQVQGSDFREAWLDK